MPIEAVGHRWIDDLPINRHTLVAAGTAMLAGAVVLGVSKKIKGLPNKPRGPLFQDFIRLANKAWFWVVVAATIIFGIPLTVSYVSPASSIHSEVVPPPTSPPPSPPAGRSKQTISDLLTESGSLLNIVETTLVPLEHQWRVSLGGQNPERICLGTIDSQGHQKVISDIAERLLASEKSLLEVLEQNRIDRAELAPLIGYQNNFLDAKLSASSSYLIGYRNVIKNLGDKPTCDVVVAQDISRQFHEMTNVLNSFNEWLSQSQERLKKYRDALRIEARNAP
jgi:hypothetical protein